jgi:hypothetical protein
MLLKVGTNFEPDQRLLPALREADEAFKAINSYLVITSLKDRQHSSGSLHYAGLAFDCRIRHLDSSDIERVYASLVARLADAYNVILEKTHIHIEVRL